MQAELSWLALLAVLPGVALLIVSTAARYSRLHDEVHFLQHHAAELTPRYLRHTRQRARLFRNAMVHLYFSVSVIALAAVMGVVMETVVNFELQTLITLSGGIGIASLLFATLQLIAEAILSLEIIEAHLAHLEKGE